MEFLQSGKAAAFEASPSAQHFPRPYRLVDFLVDWLFLVVVWKRQFQHVGTTRVVVFS